jgi:hypothetical protein
MPRIDQGQPCNDLLEASLHTGKTPAYNSMKTSNLLYFAKHQTV